jgi:hypothetical protein
MRFVICTTAEGDEGPVPERGHAEALHLHPLPHHVPRLTAPPSSSSVSTSSSWHKSAVEATAYRSLCRPPLVATKSDSNQWSSGSAQHAARASHVPPTPVSASTSNATSSSVTSRCTPSSRMASPRSHASGAFASARHRRNMSAATSKASMPTFSLLTLSFLITIYPITHVVWQHGMRTELEPEVVTMVSGGVW